MRKIKYIAILFLFCFTAFPALAQQKYALLVGINKYYDAPGVMHRSILRGCVNDALAMKSMLKQRFGFSENNIQVLTDEDATMQHVIDGLNNMLQKCKAGDAVVFYFSGHGVWMNNREQSKLDAAVKEGMNQAMVMSDLYADNLGCLFTDKLVKKTFNKFIDKKAVPTAIFDCCFSGKLPAKYSVIFHNPYDPVLPPPAIDKSLSFADILYSCEGYSLDTKGSFSEDSLNTIWKERLADHSKSFNVSDSLFIKDASHITLPSQRTGSMFLSLAATDERTKGLDIADETGTYHGAYTSALLHVIRKNPSDISVAELIRKTDLEIKKQGYPASMHFQDNARLSKNLIGINAINFNNNTIAVCTANTGKEIRLDAGLLDGLAVDNTMAAANKKTSLKITAAAANSATAALINGNAADIKPGDRFFLTGSFTKSAPYIKVFISGAEISTTAFNKFFTGLVKPLVRLPNYNDYENWNKSPSLNLVFDTIPKNPPETAVSLLINARQDTFFVFLPIPSVITTELKSLLQKNQNVQVVNSAADAQLVLYLNYIKPGKNRKPHFIFTWTKLDDRDVNYQDALHFSKKNVTVLNLDMDSKKARALAVQIQDLLVSPIRMHTSNWLNDWPE